jgi:large subunit ribosomal protein L21
MYAIIQTGGKQFRVKKGDIIDVELLDSASDQSIEFKEIIMLNDGTTTKIGLPTVEKCLVKGEILAEALGPKVVSYKYKRRKNYHRKRGHRQKYSRIKITDIALV